MQSTFFCLLIHAIKLVMFQNNRKKIISLFFICLLGIGAIYEFFSNNRKSYEARSSEKRTDTTLKRAFKYPIKVERGEEKTSSPSLYPHCQMLFRELLDKSLHEGLDLLFDEECLKDVDKVLGGTHGPHSDKLTQGFVLRILALDSLYSDEDILKKLETVGTDVLYHKLLAFILLKKDSTSDFIKMADEIISRSDGNGNAYDAHKLKILGALSSKHLSFEKESFLSSLHELLEQKKEGGFPQNNLEKDFLDELSFMRLIIEPEEATEDNNLEKMALSYAQEYPESFRGPYYQAVSSWEKGEIKKTLNYLHIAKNKVKNPSEQAVVNFALKRIQEEHISFKDSIKAFSLSLDMKRLASELEN